MPPPRPRYAAPELSDRVLRLLGALVREYIEHGEPVSSQWLAGHAGCAVSSATVRNVLARLEEQGFVKQPHTSAGRVPTDLGYRQYVDGLMQGRRPARPLAGGRGPPAPGRRRSPEVLAHASHELARQSQHVGFAWAPADRAAAAAHRVRPARRRPRPGRGRRDERRGGAQGGAVRRARRRASS